MFSNVGRAFALAVAAALAIGLVLAVPPSGPAQAASWPRVTLLSAWQGLDSPVHIANAGDDTERLFVVEKAGRIRVIRDGQVKATPFLDINTRVSGGSEQGLLSVAFPPGYAAKKYFYVNYTDTDGDTVVARYSVGGDPDRANPSTEEVILTVDQPYSNHNGGQLAFGPDGYLYVGLGDGGSGGDPLEHGQDPSTWLGSILRIDVEGAATPYGVPPDNPFVGVPGHKPEIWAYGLRNPWRFSFDRDTGGLYIGDVGQSQWEEIDFEPAGSPGGRNYGWDMYEGDHVYEPPANPSGLTFPVWEYDHATQGHSVTGGFVYRGSEFPALDGIYIYGDYEYGRLWGLRWTGAVWENTLFMETPYLITTFGEAEDGAVYLADYGGTIYKVADADEVSNVSSFSRVAGPDRYQTAVAASKRAFPGGADAVVLARGDAFPDALSASGLAGSYDGPVLLTRSASLPAETLAEMHRLDASQVVIVGGSTAVAGAVENALRAEGFGVTRIAGADRYATAANVARTIEDREGTVGRVLIATGENFPDVLAGAPISYSQGMPVLLVRRSGVPRATSDALSELSPARALVVGGPVPIPESVRNDLGVPSDRVSGQNRYGTAVAVAEHAFSQGWSSWVRVGIATGETFPDGLAGGAALGSRGGVLMLSRPTSLPQETELALHRHQGDIAAVEVLGGTQAISGTTFTSIRDALR